MCEYYLLQETCLSCSVLAAEDTADGEDTWLLGLSSGHLLAVKGGEVDKKVKAHKKAVQSIIVAKGVRKGGGDERV